MADYFIKCKNSEQRFLTATNLPATDIYFAKTRNDLLIGSLDDEFIQQLQEKDIELIPARKCQLVNYGTIDQRYVPLVHHPQNLNHVLSKIKATQSWEISRGENVHIAIIDSGICGTMPEFPAWKKSPHSWSYHGEAWTDIYGHGSMSACIAAATSRSGGRYDGVAPDAKLIPCKTSFKDTELFQIYEFLIGLVDKGEVGRLVINNSYALYQCNPPDINPEEDLLISIIRHAVKKGIVVVFAAGNNHVKVCGHDPFQCGPNSIWGPNSIDEVISVGTVDRHNRMDREPSVPNSFSHRDSSRGPGQFANRTTKPDCVAPTYGEVMWGCGYISLECWGSSGAAPQVAGLAALLLSKFPHLTPEQIRNSICQGCLNLPLNRECVGAGLIDCQSALLQGEAISGTAQQ